MVFCSFSVPPQDPVIQNAQSVEGVSYVIVVEGTQTDVTCLAADGRLVTLYLLVLEKGQAGAFYFAENGENSMREAACAISDALGFGASGRAMSVDEAIAAWGEGGVEERSCSNRIGFASRSSIKSR